MICFQSLLWFVLELAFRALELTVHKFLTVIIGSRKGKLPKIKDDILKESVVDLAEKIRTRQISSEEVVKACIRRIVDVNPVINAVVDKRFNQAIDDAKAIDEYITNSGKSPEELAREKPLLGVPFSSKNAIGIEGLTLNSGVVIKKNDKAKEDSEAVASLRRAGAIPLCISNVPEYCMWMDSSCKLYGKTLNPYDLTRIPGGSSGGEAALVTSAATFFGVGNDLGGSIRIPSYNCGVFGHKPTKRIVSNKGQFPSSYRTDLDNFNVTGPIARHAKDLLPLLKVLAGENKSKLKLSENVDLKKVQVYYTDDYGKGGFLCPLNFQLRNSVLKAVLHLEDVTGNTAKRIKLPVPMTRFPSMMYTKYATAKAPSLIEVVTGKEESLFDIPFEFVKWFFRVSKHTLHFLYYVAAVKYSNVTQPEVVKRNNELLERLDRELNETLGENGVFIFPPQPDLPYYHEEQIFKLQNICYTSIFNFLGYPSTECPMGLSKEGLPLGVQVIGTQHNDRLTIAVAEEIDKAFGGWVNPAR